MKQTGARYLKTRRELLNDKQVVCVQHYRTESEFMRVSDRVVKRIRKGSK